MIVWPATALVVIWAMYDAYKTAKKMDQATRKRLAEKTT
jgi:hypothetical protein